MKSVLVTGASGFIGRHCLPILAGRGWDVHAVSTKQRPHATTPRWHQADLRDREQVHSLLDRVRPTHLLHLAWYVEPGRWADAPENFSWVQASLDVLVQFSEHGGRRIVTAGSCYEYDWRYGFCSEETTPLAPATFYGRCKHGVQLLFTSYAASAGLSSAWGRVFFVYGPHEHPQRLVASVSRALLSGQPARCSHGNQIRDYLHVEDVADALIALLESDVAGPVNIASGQPVMLKDIVFNIARRLDRIELVRLSAIATRPDEAPVVVADVSRLRRELAWRPSYDLDSGLEKTLQWWRGTGAGFAEAAGEGPPALTAAN